MAKLTFLWYDNFGKKRPLLRNGMTAIPKIGKKEKRKKGWMEQKKERKF